jgi:dihydroorotate dehydrogenase
LFVKLAPDLDDAALADLVAACIEAGAAGLIISNTTLARPAGLRGRHRGEAGGLSGAPLRQRATAMLRLVARLAEGRLSLIGVGGVASGADVLEKLGAGASFVQLYTALALEGPALLPRLKRELLAELDRAGLPDVTTAIGSGL